MLTVSGADWRDGDARATHRPGSPVAEAAALTYQLRERRQLTLTVNGGGSVTGSRVTTATW
jgi:hypothetical protein